MSQVAPRNIPVYTIHLPQYQVNTRPDYKAIGRPVDEALRKHFFGQTIAVRGLGLADHPGRSIDELVEIIQKLGTDRYDPARSGDRYDNVNGKHIDLFVLRRKITQHSQIFWQLAWSFYESPLKNRGYPVRVDILIIYDPAKLKSVRTVHTHEGYPVLKQDGHVFRDPANKPAAIRAIFKILP